MIMCLNRVMTRHQVVEQYGIPPECEEAVFAVVRPSFGQGAAVFYVESEIDRQLGQWAKNRPSSVGSESSFEKENSMIAINQEMEPFERIALGIERLIEVLVPQEAPSSPAVERLSPLAAAKQMRLNEQTVMKWCREGRLVASKLGGKWLIPQESVDAFIRKCEVIHGRRGGK